MAELDFDQLRREVWPMGTPTAVDREPQLYDYALGGLELAVSELERRTEVALRRSQRLLYMAEHPEDFDFTAR